MSAAELKSHHARFRRVVSGAAVAIALSAMLLGCGSQEGMPDGDPISDDTVASSVDTVYAYLAAGLYRRAQAMVDTLLATNPERGEVWYIAGVVDRSFGRFADARESLDRAVAIDPANPVYWHEAGNLAVREQRYEDAVRFYGRSADEGGGVQAWHGLGRAYLAVGANDSARVVLEKAIEVAASYPGAYAAMSELEEQEGNLETAVEMMRQAYSRDPASSEFQSDLGRLLVQQGKATEALVHLRPLLRERPVRSQTLYATGRALQDLGEADRASAVLDEFERQSHLEATIFRLEERVRLSPDRWDERLKLVDALREAGEYRRAINHLLVVDAVSSPNAGIQRNLGALYAAAGDSSRAEVYYRLAEEIVAE